MLCVPHRLYRVKGVILLVILYGCGTACIPWLFDIKVQRGIFVPKRERETERGMNWYYEELYNWSSCCVLKMVKS